MPRIESPREWAQRLKEIRDYRALAATITDRAYDPRVEAQRQKRLHAMDALEEAGSEAVDSILDVAGAGMGALAGEDLAELLVKIGDPKAVPFLKKMLDRDEFYSSTKGRVEGFVSRYPELYGAAEITFCSLCGKSRPVNELRHVNPDYYFCRDTCWNRRGKIVGSKNAGALGCPFYSEGMCTVDGGNTCSLSFGSYNTTCYVYRIGTTRGF